MSTYSTMSYRPQNCYTSKYGHVSSSNYGSSSRSSPAPVHGRETHTQTRAIPNNNTSERRRDYESRTAIGSYGRPPSGSRTLPNGPGPLDSQNRKISVDTAITNASTSSFKSRNNRKYEVERAGPVKATENFHGLSYTPVGSRTGTPRTTLSNGYDTNNTSSVKGSNSTLRRNKHYSSTSSVHSDSIASLSEDMRDLKTNSTHTHTIDLNNGSALPDIHTSSRVGSGEKERTRESRGVSNGERPGSRRSSSSTRVSRHNSFEYDAKPETSKYSSSYKSSFDSDLANNNRGLMGLSNLGNTCYMNSMIQGLANTGPLREYLEEDWKLDINASSRMKGSLIKAFAKLVTNMWGRTTSDHVSPRDFRSELTRYARRFAGYGQQDAQEFLMFLVEGLHEDVNRIQKKVQKTMLDDEYDDLPARDKARVSWKWYLSYDNSFMVDLFVGQLKSSLTCNVCGYVSNTFDPFWEIPLPLKKQRYSREMKLSECFDEFTQEETLDRDERPTCARCKKRQSCKKAFSIWKFPRILILHLKRFDPMAAYPTKLTTPVDFPVDHLNLSNYAADNRAASNCTYDLYSVSNHSGTARGGHYTAYTKHPYTGEWHHFNDTRCSSLSKRSIVSPEAYVLFYERRDSKHNSHL